MLRSSVSTVCSFVCVLVMKQKTVSLILKAQGYITYNAHDKCAIFNPTNQTLGTPAACLLILSKMKERLICHNLC